MSKFILIPKEAIRYGLSPMIINLDNVVGVSAREERDLPLLVFELGSKELSIKFNNPTTRDELFSFIVNTSECHQNVLLTDPAVDSTPKKNRRGTRN